MHCSTYKAYFASLFNHTTNVKEKKIVFLDLFHNNKFTKKISNIYLLSYATTLCLCVYVCVCV